MIVCRTPFRISFFGGGTDFPNWYNKNSGSVIAVTINKYSYITARQLPNFFDYNYRIRYFKTEQVKKISNIEHPSFREIIKRYNENNKNLEIVHNADLPAMTGLGSSSSTTVGTINAILSLNNKTISKKNLALKAIEIEQKILKENVGSQDQIITAFGGFKHIRFDRKSKIHITELKNKSNIKKIENGLFLVFTGLTRKADIIEKDKILNCKKKSKYYRKLNMLTDQAKLLIESNNFSLKKFGELLSKNWSYKKNLSKLVTNKKIDKLYDIGVKNGAYGGKLLGAGNGGFLLFICNSKTKKILKKKFDKYLNIPIKFEKYGSQIVKYKNK